jgi:hypothetical protein
MALKHTEILLREFDLHVYFHQNMTQTLFLIQNSKGMNCSWSESVR